MREKRIMIELSVPYFHHPREVIRGVYDYAIRSCPEWTFISEPYDFYQSFRFRSRIGKVDGILLSVSGPSSGTDAIVRSGVPTVNVALPAPEMPFPAVVVDDRAIGRTAARHLADTIPGATLFVGPENHRAQLRFAAFRETLVQREQPEPRWLYEDNQHPATTFQRHLRRILRELADSANGRIAVFAYSDSFANAVSQTAAGMRLRIPQDMVILGVDNDELICDLARPPLSSIPVNSRLLGFRAAEKLHCLMQGETVEPFTMILPEHPVERLSTRALKTDDPVIAAAMNMIHKFVFDGIQVAEVVDALPIARRTFETRFRQAVGRSPYEEILRLRFEKAARLLRENKLNNGEIATACGFGSTTRFEQSLRKHTGRRPSEFRE